MRSDIRCNQWHYPEDNPRATHFYKNLYPVALSSGRHIFSTSNYVARCDTHLLDTNDKLMHSALEIDEEVFIIESVMET